MADGTETVTLKLPSGEMVDAVVPAGMPDAAIQNMMRAKHPEFFQSAPAPQQAAALGNKALAAINPGLQGTQVGRLPNIQMQLPGSIPRALTAAGATLPSASPYDPNRSIIQQQMENMRSANPSNAAAAGKELLNRFATGDIAGGVGEVGGYLAQALLAKKALGESRPGMDVQPFQEGILPSDIKARASSSFQDLQQNLGSRPVDTTISQMAAENAKAVASRGGQMPKVVRDYLRRINDPDQGPLTYAEAQDFMQNASAKTAPDISGNPLRGNMKPAMGKFASALRSDIAASLEAAQPGAGQQYLDAVSSYGSASRFQRNVQGIKDFAKNELARSAAKGAGAGAVGYGVYRSLNK